MSKTVLYCTAIVLLIRSPVLWTVDLIFCACFFFIFSPTHFFRRLQTDIFETFPHDVALLEKEALLCRFPKKSPLTKMRAKNAKFRPILRLIAKYYAPSLVMWKENRTSKTRMLAIKVSIPNLKIARLVQFWPWQFEVWTINMNAHTWLTE